MDGRSFADEYTGMDEQYAHAEHGFGPFLPTNIVPSSAAMPVQFQGSNTHFQDMSAMQGPQLFRNDISTMHSTQSGESQQAYLSFQQQTHGDVAHPHQITDVSATNIYAGHGDGIVSPTLAKKAEDSEPACRPRLTPDQTQFLEDVFTHTPRPTTQQKKRHAAELGLTHEKVNNWFQNRRAKSKQMTRIRRELSVMNPGEIQLSHMNDVAHLPGHDMPSPLQYNEGQALASMAPMGSIPKDSGILDSNWNNPSTSSISSGSYNGHDDVPTVNQAIDLLPESMNGNMHSQSSQSSGYSSVGKPFGCAQPEWAFNDSNLVTSPDGSVQGHGPADMNQMMLSLQHNPVMASQGWNVDHDISGMVQTHPTGGDIIKQEVVTSPPSMDAEQSKPSSTAISQQATPQRSPSPKAPVSRPHPLPISPTIRRDSSTSELANNINTFHLQRLTASGGLEEEVFKTPSLNLAARRKRERPAALQPMRTVSTSNVAEPPSSSNSTAMPSTAVRRIKSAGHGLNVFNRIHKGVSSAQRSPLSQTFRDAGAMEKLHTQLNELTNGDSGSHGHSHQVSGVSSEVESQPWAISPSDSLGAAPPLSASYTQNSYEEPSWATSPPITPLYKQTGFMQSYSDIPQSAPAHITNFPNLSPPSSFHSLHSTYFTPQQQQHPTHYHNHHQQDPTFFAPVPMPTALHSQNHILKTYDMDIHQPRIMRPGSGSAHYGFFSALAAPPPKEHKELEVIMATFPTPEQRPRSLPRANGNGVFTFQNTGPKDYATSD